MVTLKKKKEFWKHVGEGGRILSVVDRPQVVSIERAEYPKNPFSALFVVNSFSQSSINGFPPDQRRLG